MLGLTVNTCSASVRDAFGRIAHNFYVAVAPFLCRMEKCAQSMPRVHEFRISLRELHGAGRVQGVSVQALAHLNLSQGLTLHRDALWICTPIS